MDQRDPLLKFDYIAQAATMLSSQERLFLDALEDNGVKALGGIQRLVFLFKRLARAVNHQNIFAFFEQVESFLTFCQENFDSLVATDKEVFVEIYDHLNSCFEKLNEDPEATLDHSEVFYAFDQVRRSVEIKTRSLSFTIGSKERPSFDKERAQIHQLAQDLDVLQKGAGAGEFGSVSLKHLRSISQRLLELGKAINLQKMSDLYAQIGKDFQPKNFRFGFYGGEHLVDRRALAALAPALEQVLESAYFCAQDERSEAFFKTSMGENVKLEVQLAMANIEKAQLGAFEFELESMGFQVFSHVDKFSGTSLSIDIPKTVNSIEGQVVELDGQFYALDMRYVKDCVKLNHENIIDLKKEALYLNHKGNCIPMLDLGNSLGLDAGKWVDKYALLLEMRGEKAAVIVDQVGRRQALTIRPLKKGMPEHRYFKSVCFLESSLPVFLLDGKKIIIDQKENELNLRKFLKVTTETVSLAIDSADIKEIAPYEKLTRVPGLSGENTAMINYQGEPVMVYSVFDRLGVASNQELRNIVICQHEGEYFGLALGGRISIKTLSAQDCYERPAIAGTIPSKLCKEAFFDEEQETVVVDVAKLFGYEGPQESGNFPLKKVA